MSAKKQEKGNIRVFVSYASEDSLAAKDLIRHLARKPNFHIFTDNRISAGEDWQSKIKKELSQTDYFLVLLSPTSLQSSWVQFELGAAWGLNKFIIPVVTSKDVMSSVPLEFKDLQVIQLKDLKTKPESIGEIIEGYEKTAA